MPRKTIAFCAGFVLAMFVGDAWAASATITWQNPTQNVDGTPIPATGAGALTGTRVEWGTCNVAAFGTRAGELVVPAPATTATIPGLAEGSTFCFRAFSQNTFGEQSATSNIISRIIPAPRPRPPVLSATVNVVWREYSDGRFVLIGMLPLGTECDPERTVSKYGASFNPVPASAVQPFPGASAPATGTYMAICGAS
jgi:hypothetical protein